jgi:cyclopropane-fatty-acyl-phospholipid synthase
VDRRYVQAVDSAAIAARLFRSAPRASAPRTFPVRLWDGTLLPPERGGVGGTLVLLSPRALQAFFPPASEARIAEAYLDGDLDLEGDAIALVDAAARWGGPRPDVALALGAAAVWAEKLLGGRRALEADARGPLHSIVRDRDAIRHHYDLSDDFYRLFLDRAMVYSCAYFPRGGEPLEEAQRAKLDLVCRKLDLSRGERFLDVGCGWGALVEHASARYDARALGITVSAHQLEGARRRVAPLGGRAEIRDADWRTLAPDAPFDKVASVGMMEHVGRARLDAYFAAVHRLLRPGGLFLNHAIAAAPDGVNTIPWLSRRGGGFIWQYVFPDGELLPIGEVVVAAERAGFEVRDLESLREHYAETLAEWLARLEARFDEAVALVGERRARLYRLYLAASAVGFLRARTSVFQLLLARRTAHGAQDGLPRWRGAWYAEGGDGAAAEPLGARGIDPGEGSWAGSRPSGSGGQ